MDKKKKVGGTKVVPMGFKPAQAEQVNFRPKFLRPVEKPNVVREVPLVWRQTARGGTWDRAHSIW